MFGVVPSYTPVDEQERARFIPACPLLVHRIRKANLSESKARPIHTRLAKDGSLMAHVALPELHCLNSLLRDAVRDRILQAPVGRTDVDHACMSRFLKTRKNTTMMR